MKHAAFIEKPAISLLRLDYATSSANWPTPNKGTHSAGLFLIWDSVSVGSVAVDLAKQIFGDLNGCKIMILGADEASERTAKAFRSRGAEQVFVSNRSFKRARALATITGGRAIHFEDWEQEFRDLNILVSSTGDPHAIITLDK